MKSLICALPIMARPSIPPSHMVLRSPVTYPELFQQSGNSGLYEEYSGSGYLCKSLARPETCTYIQMFTTSTRNREEKLKTGGQML